MQSNNTYLQCCIDKELTVVALLYVIGALLLNGFRFSVDTRNANFSALYSCKHHSPLPLSTGNRNTPTIYYLDQLTQKKKKTQEKKKKKKKKKKRRRRRGRRRRKKERKKERKKKMADWPDCCQFVETK